MKIKLKIILSFLCVSLIVFLTSCSYSNIVFSSFESCPIKIEGKNVSEDKLGRNEIGKLMTAIFNNDEKAINNLFCKTVQSNNSKLSKEIDSFLQLFKENQPSKVDYQYSVGHNDTVDGDDFDYDECLAEVYTQKEKYSFDFIVCYNDSRTDDNIGLWNIVVCDSDKREKSKKFDTFYNKYLFDVSTPSNDLTGIFLLDI